MKKIMSPSRLRKAQGLQRPQSIPGRSTPLKHASILRKLYGQKLADIGLTLGGTPMYFDEAKEAAKVVKRK